MSERVRREKEASLFGSFSLSHSVSHFAPLGETIALWLLRGDFNAGAVVVVVAVAAAAAVARARSGRRLLHLQFHSKTIENTR